MNNTESTQRQYALRQRAIALGWPVEQIVVIDIDQGQSGASAADREGFQRLVADVGLGKAGIVLGLEVSRLARNNADWHRLLEICALTGTLICDEDGLYDPADFNDRLLLGLKGTMSEAELHFIRARLRAGILSKARRGELPMPLPVGLVYDPAGKVVLDPDTGVQQALRHLFATFARTGSARAVVQAFTATGCCSPPGSAPARARASSPGRRCATGECCARPAQPALCRRVRLWPAPHPQGTQRADPASQRAAPRAVDRADPRRAPRIHHLRAVRAQPATARRQRPSARHRPRRRPRPRRPRAAARPRRSAGAAASGMTVRYHQRRDTLVPDYQCIARPSRRRRPRCLTIPGHTRRPRDQPAAARHRHPARARGRAHRPSRARSPRRAKPTSSAARHVERARHHAELARRRYLAVDPDNRLVADTLEADWNDALRAAPSQPKTTTNAPAAAANAALTDQHKPGSGSSPPTSPPCGPTPPPRNANANASPGC